MFLLVPAYPSSPGQKAVKRLCVCGTVESHWEECLWNDLFLFQLGRKTLAESVSQSKSCVSVLILVRVKDCFGVVVGWVKTWIMLAWLGCTAVPSHCRSYWQLTTGAASSSIQRDQWRQPCWKQAGYAGVHAFANGCVQLFLPPAVILCFQ